MIISTLLGLTMNIMLAQNHISDIDVDEKSKMQHYINQIISYKNIEIIRGENRDVEFPDRARPDTSYSHQDADYRIHEVLPFAEDRSQNAYIVYPKLWVILPVLTLDEDDKKLVRNKKSFDHYKYLEGWTLHYIWESPSKWDGNMVIAWHSSFFTHDLGRYKTAFQVVALSDIGDSIWYFEKNGEWYYDRYDYIINDVDQVSSKDTSILHPTGTGKELTTYTCYPFGSTANRKYNKANFIGKREWGAKSQVFAYVRQNRKIENNQIIHSSASIDKKLSSSGGIVNVDIKKRSKKWKTRKLNFWKSVWIEIVKNNEMNPKQFNLK